MALERHRPAPEAAAARRLWLRVLLVGCGQPAAGRLVARRRRRRRALQPVDGGEAGAARAAR